MWAFGYTIAELLGYSLRLHHPHGIDHKITHDWHTAIFNSASRGVLKLDICIDRRRVRPISAFFETKTNNNYFSLINYNETFQTYIRSYCE